MDIFVVGFLAATECFVKVNSCPFLFQVDLAGEIDTKESSGVVNQNGVHFFLVKVRLLISSIMYIMSSSFAEESCTSHKSYPFNTTLFFGWELVFLHRFITFAC
jgi:hypothetical protein